MTQEPVLATPAVLPAAAADLFRHLREQGRAKGDAQELARVLARALERTWGTGSAKRFSDKDGGGWFVDLSDYFDGEMLYGIVRSGPGGSRTLDSVVDADAIEAWQRGSPDAIAGAGAVDQGTSRDASNVDLREEPVKRAHIPNPNDPMLVVVSVGEKRDIHRCTRAEVSALITKLIRIGAGGVLLTEDQIEIWSSLSKPKVEITF